MHQGLNIRFEPFPSFKLYAKARIELQQPSKDVAFHISLKRELQNATLYCRAEKEKRVVNPKPNISRNIVNEKRQRKDGDQLIHALAKAG